MPRSPLSKLRSPARARSWSSTTTTLATRDRCVATALWVTRSGLCDQFAERSLDLHASPGPRSAADDQAATDERAALVHPCQSDPLATDDAGLSRCESEAAAPIAYLQVQVVGASLEGHGDSFRMGMFAHIRQRLLHNAE